MTALYKIKRDRNFNEIQVTFRMLARNDVLFPRYSWKKLIELRN